MFCRKCGQELPEKSLFCYKCGRKVIIEETLDEELVVKDSEVLGSKNSEESKYEEVKNNQGKLKSKKPSKVTVVSLVLMVLVFSLIGYNSYSSSRLNEARGLYFSGKYYDAYDKVKGLLYIGEVKNEVDKIKLSGEVGGWFQFYDEEINPEYDWKSTDYKIALRLLLNGLTEIKTHENIVDSERDKNILNEFRERYHTELNYKFGISKTKAADMLELDYDELDKQIEDISEKVKNEEAEIVNNRKNPIEFKNLDWDSNSSYTIATGQVYNRGDRTLKFVTIKVSFKDKNGNVIDTDSTYAVGSEGLAPGESTKWRASVKRDKNIDSYSVSVIDFRY